MAFRHCLKHRSWCRFVVSVCAPPAHDRRGVNMQGTMKWEPRFRNMPGWSRHARSKNELQCHLCDWTVFTSLHRVSRHFFSAENLYQCKPHVRNWCRCQKLVCKATKIHENCITPNIKIPWIFYEGYSWSFHFQVVLIKTSSNMVILFRRTDDKGRAEKCKLTV